ncbi:MAG: hypothetical protein HC842_09015, partial [Cytophagales bacterium]|nr:hypothetical protein [Cytophagales bacterium]
MMPTKAATEKQRSGRQLGVGCCPLGLLLVSCFPEDDQFSSDPALDLRISVDTLQFDTLISGLQHPTRRFTVVNPHRVALRVGPIYLGRGAASAYQVVVNGRNLETSLNTDLLAGDSMLVLVSVFIPPQDTDEAYDQRDSLIFTTNGNRQEVKLRAWGQDVRLLTDSVLACGTVLSGQRPYRITRSIRVDSGCVL